MACKCVCVRACLLVCVCVYVRVYELCVYDNKKAGAHFPNRFSTTEAGTAEVELSLIFPA